MTTTVEIVSKEMIKPSSPTPHHLRNHKLSFLDQLAPPIYIRLVFFYQPENKNDVNCTQISQMLKQSLSNTLTQYYPLAGRINIGNFSLDCDDAGVEYVETRVHAQLAQLIEEPSMEELKQYFPKESYSEEDSKVGDIVPLAIQINFFTCGGIAIGVCISHKIADGTSLANFMNAWAATCRGDCSGQNLAEAHEVVQPIFDWTGHFPPKDMSGFGSWPNYGITEEKIVTKRLVFNKEKLATLKEAAASAAGSQVKDPTRMEAVTAFIWRHFIDQNYVPVDEKMDNNKSFAAIHIVNLRPRMRPSLPEHAIGNIWCHTIALSTPGEGKGHHNLVGRLRSAIRNINSNYVKKMQEWDDEYLSSLKEAVEVYSSKDIEFCSFSSWCRFPFYEVNYGWGKPVWVCTLALPFRNSVFLMSTSCGEGIEAWVNMVENDVPKLKIDLNLQHNL